MRIPAYSTCFAQLRRGISALATPSAVTTPPWVKDAIADYSEIGDEHGVHEFIANYACAMVTTQEVTDAVSYGGLRTNSASGHGCLAPEARRQYCPSKEAKYDC